MDTLTLARLLGQIPAPTEANPDYDLMGYLAKYGQPDQSKGQHLTDEFKLPEHPSFSEGSRYSAPDMQGGQWQRGGKKLWEFTPSQQNIDNMGIQGLLDYFKERENRGTFVKINGHRQEGTFVPQNGPWQEDK
jgi:hypothetical protein